MTQCLHANQISYTEKKNKLLNDYIRLHNKHAKKR